MQFFRIITKKNLESKIFQFSNYSNLKPKSLLLLKKKRQNGPLHTNLREDTWLTTIYCWQTTWRLVDFCNPYTFYSLREIIYLKGERGNIYKTFNLPLRIAIKPLVSCMQVEIYVWLYLHTTRGDLYIPNQW